MTTANLATAAIRLPWALSVFGTQELVGGLLKLPQVPAKKTLDDLYAVTEASQAQFESNAFLFAAYQIGDRTQRALTGVMHDALAGRVLDPHYLRGLGSEIIDTSMDALGSLATENARRLTIQITKNKLTVIGLVNGVAAKLALPASGEVPLAEMIEKCYALGEYPALWAIEGLGECYARNAMQTGANPKALLTEGQGAELADGALPMLHAGIGITFAKRVVSTLNPWLEAAKIDEAMRWFLSLSTENSRPGHLGATIESLGLVTGTWHRQMLYPISQSLTRIDSDAREFYWHGVGRSMFFDPINMIPGFSAWRQSETEPLDEVACLNARAGVAWAFSLVNRQQPEIVSAALKFNRQEIKQNDGFSNGVVSTMIMASQTVPDDKFEAAFCAYQPDQADHVAAQMWNEQLGTNLATRVATYRWNLRAMGKPGEIFRYHRLAEFAGTKPVAAETKRPAAPRVRKDAPRRSRPARSPRT